jgi:hypothetical protein
MAGVPPLPPWTVALKSSVFNLVDGEKEYIKSWYIPFYLDYKSSKF